MYPVITFNDKQMLAVEYPPKPLLILAGAGTGKTTTIVGRIAHLIQKQKVAPKSILALTFTNDGADHLKRKLIEKIGESGESIHACTFHSFAQAQTNTYFKEIANHSPIDVTLYNIPMFASPIDVIWCWRRRSFKRKRYKSNP